MITGKGQKLAHEQLITQSLEALTLPSEIAIVHVRGHQTGNSLEARGNRQVDAAAKQAALAEKIHMYQLLPTPIEIKKTPIFSREEEVSIKDKGFRHTADGLWWTVDGRQVLNKAITRQVINQLHQKTHWGTQSLVDTFGRFLHCPGIYNITKLATRSCPICQRVNKKSMRHVIPGGRDIAVRLFQRIQIDFTELPNIGIYKFLLVMVDHFTRWVEAFPTPNDRANTVIRILIEC
ncbi:uncharacterized protein [Narcine bancroftii]|uniref:uncharacterized protein n=1 Tax=Narcine bancroftii TaxID=1343680 RepID=UPI00383226BE